MNSIITIKKCSDLNTTVVRPLPNKQPHIISRVITPRVPTLYEIISVRLWFISVQPSYTQLVWRPLGDWLRPIHATGLHHYTRKSMLRPPKQAYRVISIGAITPIRILISKSRYITTRPQSKSHYKHTQLVHGLHATGSNKCIKQLTN